MTRRSILFAIAILSFVLVFKYGIDPGTAKSQEPSEEPALPESIPEVDIVASDSKSYVLSVVRFIGPDALADEGSDVVKKNFGLMPGYRVKDPEGLGRNPQSNGIDFDVRGWGAAGIDGVVKGRVEQTSPDNLVLTVRFFRVGAKVNPALERRYSGKPEMLRKWLHAFSNDILQMLTGKAGVFDRKIAYAKRNAPGEKNVFCAEMNGHHQLQITRGAGLAMLPMFDAKKRVWFTKMTDSGMYISRTGLKGRPLISGKGLNMAPAACHGRVFFASSRDGNSEIYSADEDGKDIQRLTNHPAIDVSPNCGPDGRIAFVSARHGSPQIFVMNADGSGAKRVTFKGGHNQTPAWCQDPSNRNLIAFTGRDANLDIFTVDIATQEYTRVTQGQGDNKDPSFSPDCRLLAFVSDRKGAPGIYLSSLKGFNQTRVVEGSAQSVRFQP